MSSLPPNLINERGRRTEVARLLALGILRRKIRLSRQFEPTHSSNSLDFGVFQAFMPPKTHGTKNQKTKEKQMDKTLLARVAALPNMPLSDLKALWRDVYQDEPHAKHFRGHKSHIVRRLAYRLCRSLLTALTVDRKPDRTASQ